MRPSIYRIYITKNRLGRLQQSNQVTRDFYDVVPARFSEADGTCWYPIVSSSPGCAFSTLWKARQAAGSHACTVNGLGARTRLFGEQWYVDARDISLSQAACLNRVVLTWPKALSLGMALIVLAYFVAMTAYSITTGQAIPAIQPLARFAAMVMLVMLGIEFLLRRVHRWMQETLGVW